MGRGCWSIRGPSRSRCGPRGTSTSRRCARRWRSDALGMNDPACGVVGAVRRLKKIVLWGGGALLAALIVFSSPRAALARTPGARDGLRGGAPPLGGARRHGGAPRATRRGRSSCTFQRSRPPPSRAATPTAPTSIPTRAATTGTARGWWGWLLRRHAPRSFSRLGRERPVAADFARLIARSNTEPVASGWQRIARIEDVEAGDVFAWALAARAPQREQHGPRGHRPRRAEARGLVGRRVVGAHRRLDHGASRGRLAARACRPRWWPRHRG
jgi:hypothetical protein